MTLRVEKPSTAMHKATPRLTALDEPVRGHRTPALVTKSFKSVQLLILLSVLAATALMLDLTIPLGMGGGLIYVSIVILALRFPKPKHILLTGIVCAGLAIFGLVLSTFWSGLPEWIVVTNRSLAVAVIGFTAWLGAQYKEKQYREESLTGILEKSLNEIYIFNADTLRFIQVNEGARHNLGYSLEELREMTPLDIKPDFSAEKFEELIRPLRNLQKEKIIFKTVHRRKNGSIYPVEVHLQAQISEATPVFAAIILDITERTQAESDANKIQQRLQAALDAGELGEWSLDVASGIAQRSLRHDQIFGYDEPLAVWNYARFLQHVYADDRATVDAAFQKSLTEGADWNFETRILRADGTLRWIWGRGTVTQTDGNKPLRLSGIVQDITPRKRTEAGNQFLADIAAPLNTLGNYEGILQEVVCLAIPQLADWCVIDLIDEHGGFCRVANSLAAPDTNAGVDKLRLTRFEPVSGSVAKSSSLRQILVQAQPSHINNLNDTDLQALANDPDQLIILRDLQPRAFVGVPMMLRERCLGVMSFYMRESGRQFTQTDIEIVKRVAEHVTVAMVNAKLYQSIRQADEQKDTFLAMLAHELRNPLGALSNGLAVLCEQLPNGQTRQTLEMMDRQKRQLTRLLDDLLDVSRISRGKVVLDKRHIRVNPVLTSAVESIKSKLEEKQQTFARHFRSGALWLDADPVRLEQIVTNMLSNAVKYTPAGGAITLSTARDGHNLIIEVADTGIGIARDQLQSVFELFTQVSNEESSATTGLGLGLALVRELVEMHGGAVVVASEGKGQGSVFTVRLPILQDSLVESRASHTPGNVVQNGLDILIVDDNEDSIEALGVVLELRGHQVRLAFDGKSALQAVQEQRPHLILLDIGLPDMNGYAVAEHIIADSRNESIHLVALTGYGQPQDQERSLAVGFDDHLVKPLNFEMLEQIIGRQLNHTNGDTQRKEANLN